MCSNKSEGEKSTARKRNKPRRPAKSAAKSSRASELSAQAAPNPPVPGHGALTRVLKYGEKIYGLCSGLRKVRDKRVRPGIPGGQVAVAFLITILARLGSLNALEQRKAPPAWVAWMGGPLPLADVMGDAACSLDLGPLRSLLLQQHRRYKRNKGFARGNDGFRYLILDGHEGVSSYRRTWKECLERVVHFDKGDRTQSYFRYVGAYLTNGKHPILLDAERQLPGEGEIACALRLLERLLEKCPRAFDVVCGDNAYMDPALWKLVRGHKKHLIAVLKNENRDLLVDARALFAGMAPVVYDSENVKRLCWDLEGFTTWPQCGEPVRVVRSVETSSIKRQRSKKSETMETEWFWVTSLPSLLAPTRAIVRAGHGRWDIENHGFNELGNQWHGDHGYRYNAHALLACTLLLFIAYNLFHSFIERNIKPEARAGRTAKYWADLIAADFIGVFHLSARPG